MPVFPMKTIWIRRNLAAGIFFLTLLFGAVITSLIPAKYSATSVVGFNKIPTEIVNIDDIISDEDYLKSIISTETSIIRSEGIINNVAKNLKLEQTPEFNISLDSNRALTTKLMDKIYSNDDKIFDKINKNLQLSFTNDFKVHIKYTSSMPYLAKAISNNIAMEYNKYNSPKISKAIMKKSDTPQNISMPDIKYATMITLIIGLFLGIIGAAYLPSPNIHHIKRK